MRAEVVDKVGLSLEKITVLKNLYKEQNYTNIARQILTAFEQIVDKVKKEQNNFFILNNSIHKRPRLAFISPFPPEKTGIADYSAELIPELARYYDIELITDQNILSDPWLVANFPVRTTRWFEENSDCFDRLLYHVGNSPFHCHMYGLLKKYPGVVVLHDFFLSHMCAGLEHIYSVPEVYSHILYHAHGYPALQTLAKKGHEEAIWQYPANLCVFENAVGTIVHSRLAVQFAKQWYGVEASCDWSIVPHLRVLNKRKSREEARHRLKLEEQDFVVCSFGMLGPAKLNDLLLTAWLSSSLGRDSQNTWLIFVGQNDGGEYGQMLLRRIKESSAAKRIRITGFASPGQYSDWLAAADVAVQLRTNTRGETSGTVLDVLANGIPTIINAHGTNAEYPDDVLIKLPDNFEENDLVSALESLYTDSQWCKNLQKKGPAYVAEHHSPDRIAEQYYSAIEDFYSNAGLKRYQQLLRSLGNIFKSDSGEKADLVSTAHAVAENFLICRQRHLFLDISVLVQTDLKTGIERVTRAIMIELLKRHPTEIRVEPIYWKDGSFYYARSFTRQFLGLDLDIAKDSIVEFKKDDILLSLEVSPATVLEGRNRLQRLAIKGVNIFYFVHDILPLEHPEWFPDEDTGFQNWFNTINNIAKGLICVSRSTANGVSTWLKEHPPERIESLQIMYSHHGADIDQSLPTKGQPPWATDFLDKVRSEYSFLMVGTIEPRKGHLQAIKAFELLWEAGISVNLIIVGHEGWKQVPEHQRRTIPEIVSRIDNHPQLNTHLFWLEGISDDFLEKIYAASTCLIAASEGEGFGLPLIEAAQHNLPIIARDLPVFREVAGNHALFFQGKDPVDLAQAVQKWMNLHKSDTHPRSDDMPWLTWEQSSDNLYQLLIDCVDSYGYSNKISHDSADLMEVLEFKRKKKIYIDISVVYREDYQTGIQRVTRAMLYNLIHCFPEDYTVVPVFIDAEKGSEGWLYRIASSYLQKMNLPVSLIPQKIRDDGEKINPQPGDIFLGLDLAAGYVVGAGKEKYYETLKNEGVGVYFFIYDLLPVTSPHFFSKADSVCHDDWLKTIVQGSGVICISKATADEFRTWVKKNKIVVKKPFAVEWIHLGADVEKSMPSIGLPENAFQIISRIEQCISFLMVGTIEPRKGYLQTLKAMEALWATGYDVNLVIVGKQGWSVESLIKNITAHPEFNVRLFWLGGISDEYLEKIYAVSTCLIAASEGEGFGLPLIEAAQRNLPIIARDIPVFREVAGDHAFYFQGKKQEDLVQAIQKWINLYKSGTHPGPEDMPWLTWEQSAERLKEILLAGEEKKPYLGMVKNRQIRQI
jgi:glycosyltransferase involved in cell wall biosynthesis